MRAPNCSIAVIALSLVGFAGGSSAAQPSPAPEQHAATAGPTDQPAAHAPDAKHVEWGYEGPNGADNWFKLSQDFRHCSLGQQESPIDLRDPIAARLGRLHLNWGKVPLNVANNGHTLQVASAGGSTMSLGGSTYSLAQFHLHHPSEHLLAGRRFPLEIHFVHQGPNGVLGVVGIFVAEGRANPALQAVLDAKPAAKGEVSTTSKTIDLAAFLPPRRQFFRYEGSLTTPPCSENVNWVVMSEPIQASKAQIAAFAALYPMNARPIQPVHRRFLLRSP